jgi:HSP20 family molecular chaperone IbpA
MTENRNVARESSATEQPALLPPVDVVEDAGGITLYADLPGVSKDKLDVHVDGDTLIIEAEMGLEMPQDLQATHIEVSVPRYRRVFTLSKELDAERLSAELKHGVLKVRLHKAEHAKPRRIKVQVG